MMVEETQQGRNLLPLIGTEEANVDDKGRILIGTKLRTRLGPNFAIYLGENNQLVALPEAAWNSMVDNLMNADSHSEPREIYGTDFFGSAEDQLNCDAQGRVVIPKDLRKSAGIGNQAKIVGNGNSMWIWGLENYDVYMLKQGSREQRMRQAHADMVDPNQYRMRLAINGAVN